MQDVLQYGVHSDARQEAEPNGPTPAGLKLHDDRVIRLLETPLHPGGFVRDWDVLRAARTRRRSPSPGH